MNFLVAFSVSVGVDCGSSNSAMMTFGKTPCEALLKLEAELTNERFISC